MRLRNLLTLAASVFLSAWVRAEAAAPVLCFSDLTGGPRTGNSDTSQQQTAGRDGAIVTVWGKNLGAAQGKSTVTAGGAEARVYSWGDALAPADLAARHHMQMICFQVPAAAKDGPGEIFVTVDGKKSNALPFTVRPGRIGFVKADGRDAAAGDWDHPWGTLPGAVRKQRPGDIVYVCDGVRQTARDQLNAALVPNVNGEPDKPIALVGYPGAKTLIGTEDIDRGIQPYVSGKGRGQYWTFAKLNVIAKTNVVLMNTGCRLVGSHISAPKGDAAEGAIGAEGNDLAIIGNEVTGVGKADCDKLYHPCYVSSPRATKGPRFPTQTNREIAWNYFHDNHAPRAVNIYSMHASTAFMTSHLVHDNFIIDQGGDGMLIGHYTCGENWVYNNVIVRAGQGLDPNGKPDASERTSHCGIDFDAGDAAFPGGTVIHCANNTLYGCGRPGAKSSNGSGAIQFTGLDNYKLDFSNNIIVSTGEPFVTGWSKGPLPPRAGHNLWFGPGGPPPAWDTAPVVADPQFVDAAHGDFHLLPRSPALGPPVGKPVLGDFDGLLRPATGLSALGAFQPERVKQ